MPYHLGADTHGGMAHLDLASLGIPSEEDHLKAYCAAVGRDAIPDWDYYVALVLFRNAQISLGILARAEKGTAASDHARRGGAPRDPRCGRGPARRRTVAGLRQIFFVTGWKHNGISAMPRVVITRGMDHGNQDQLSTSC